jgi:hypothetical protein
MSSDKAFLLTLALGLVTLKRSRGSGNRESELIADIEDVRSMLGKSRGEMALQRFKDFLDKSTSNSLTCSSEKELLEMAGVLFQRMEEEGIDRILIFVTTELKCIFGSREASLFSEISTRAYSFSDSDTTGVHMGVEIIEGLTFLLSNAGRYEMDSESLASALIGAALDGVAQSRYGYDEETNPALPSQEASTILKQLVDAYLTGFCTNRIGDSSLGNVDKLESLAQAEEMMLLRLAVLHERVGSKLQDTIRNLASQIEGR